MSLHMEASPGIAIGQFVDTHEAPGRVFNNLAFNTPLTEAEVYEALRVAFNGTICPDSLGPYSSPMGGLKITTMHDCGLFRSVALMYMATSEVAILVDKIAGHTYSAPRKPGVYDIDIRHFYLDKTNSSSGEMKTADHHFNTKSFEYLIPEMYPKIDVTEMMRQYSLSDESIIILSGLPGTGKTCIAKMMMAAHSLTQKDDVDVVYVKDSELLKMDMFWATMSHLKPDLMILDDLDAELLPRTTENPNPIVSNMLSYSDGIFDIGTKILITTNLTNSLIDKALVRPGRSFDTLCLPQLERKEAQHIWVNKFEEPLEEFESRFAGLNTISQAALMSEHQRLLKSSAPSYLLDPSISIRKLVEEGDTIAVR